MSLVDATLGQYRNRKVFVTGHTGFKGAWLIHWLHRIGAEVCGYALAAEPAGVYAAIDGDRLCDSRLKDIRDVKALTRHLKEFQPDYVFHLAAQSLVGESYVDPLKTFEVNVMGTANLLQAARQLDGPASIVVVTTDKVYENLERGEPYSESDRLGGGDPYSSSKACAEIVTDSYRKSFFPLCEHSRHQTAVATARSGNVIGGGDQNKNHLMPDIVNALVADKQVRIRNPSAVRPWQYVLEPLWGYLMLGARLMDDPDQYSGAWNFGSRPKDAITVESLVKRSIAYWGSGSYEISIDDNARHEAKLLRLDSSRAEAALDWRPTLDVDEAIRITLNWYRGQLKDSRSALALMDEDIEWFPKRLRQIGSDDGRP
jgi:CDP-glucose 4,6-dehydratase